MVSEDPNLVGEEKVAANHPTTNTQRAWYYLGTRHWELKTGDLDIRLVVEDLHKVWAVIRRFLWLVFHRVPKEQRRKAQNIFDHLNYAKNWRIQTVVALHIVLGIVSRLAYALQWNVSPELLLAMNSSEFLVGLHGDKLSYWPFITIVMIRELGPDSNSYRTGEYIHDRQGGRWLWRRVVKPTGQLFVRSWEWIVRRLGRTWRSPLWWFDRSFTQVGRFSRWIFKKLSWIWEKDRQYRWPANFGVLVWVSLRSDFPANFAAGERRVAWWKAFCANFVGRFAIMTSLYYGGQWIFSFLPFV